MVDIKFDISWEQSTCADPLEAGTYGSLGVRLGAVSITEVRDEAARTTREVVRVSAYPLALWLASAWWRLRWEEHRPNADWLLSHQLASAGGGYVWPDVTIESDGEFIHLEVNRRSREAWEPITYLNTTRTAVHASTFEAAVEDFVEVVLARLGEAGHRNSPLAEVWATVKSERRDDAIARSRRLEALLGFDAEEAPLDLLRAYASGAQEFGEAAVAELAVLATNGAAPDWSAMSEGLRHGARVRIQNYAQSRDLATGAVQQLPAHSPPWERGETAARAVRQGLNKPRGPLSNQRLSDWLGADLSVASALTPIAALARRERPDVPDLTVCYRSPHLDGRRFELARLLGDHLFASTVTDHLLPATRAKTARQRAQRAFAAELLLPWEDMKERLGKSPDADSIEATASDFGVSPLLVRTRLVAKNMLPADALDVE